MRGPCVVCGAVDYPLSMGGPGICPNCDCSGGGDQKDAIIAAQKIHCEGQSAEIERLKKVISLDAVAIGNKNRIITELCDALENLNKGFATAMWEGTYRQNLELVQRAREATR